MTERIIAAAIQFAGTISLPPPARHHTIIQTMDLEMGINGTKATPETQGFLTDTGRFVNRVEAYYIALKAGQILTETNRTEKSPRLFSEDLW
ncbi:hypothetical protein [Rhizobium sp. AG207R]|uniref:hypothetical protein n=1 Tax=Rhizobium sp. AG207R TaxID=2802287 RepID=UPI0022ABD835|nr:hypothetical protein [Rhizobium sp. AG207R]MCZ3377484.1 hypothetical protein [Rhizobium sp. AG207R]